MALGQWWGNKMTVITNKIMSPTGGAVDLTKQTAAKVWANYDGVAALVKESFNLSSAVDNGVGTYAFNLTNVMATNTYAIAQAAGPAGAGNPLMGLYELAGRQAGYIGVCCAQSVPLDLSSVSITFLGDLAQ